MSEPKETILIQNTICVWVKSLPFSPLKFLFTLSHLVAFPLSCMCVTLPLPHIPLPHHLLGNPHGRFPAAYCCPGFHRNSHTHHVSCTQSHGGVSKHVTHSSCSHKLTSVRHHFSGGDDSSITKVRIEEHSDGFWRV